MLIVLKYIHGCDTNAQRLREFFGRNKVQIVRRSVILRKCSPNAAHQAADRKIETRRAVLPLVVSIWRKRQDFRRLALVTEDMCDCPINLGISAPTLFVVKRSAISNATQDKTVADAADVLAVPREPRNRSNC